MSFHDDSFDVLPTPDGRMFVRVASQVAVAGALAGGFEGIGLAVSSHLQITFVETVTLAVTAVVVDAIAGFGAGLVGGLFGQVVLGRWRRWERYRAGFTLGVVLIAAFFIVPIAREVWGRDQRYAATGMIGLIGMIGVMSWFNAGYWYRRELLGATPAVGWKLGGGAMALLLAVIGAVLRGGPRVPSEAPPPDAPNIILVTVDTLRRDHVGLYGSLLRTPNIDRLGREGIVFDDAITTLPETAPSHASMLTGLSPAVHQVVANGVPLRGGLTTVTEQLYVSGWNTGAFVSSYAVDSSERLDQGFTVYDDDFLPALRGMSEIRVARIALKLLMRFGDPTDFPSLLERAGTDTQARALAWSAEVSGPVFLWVHYFEPHAPYERHDGQPNPVDHRAILELEPGYTYTDEEASALRGLYDHEVEYTDGLIGELLAGLKAQGRLDNAYVIVVADHGESMTEHGINFTHHGVYENVLQVPLVVWASKPAFTPGTHVPQQVVVDDVANTVLGMAGLPGLPDTRSVPLLDVAMGVQIKPRPVLLMGRMGTTMEGGRLWGVRNPEGIKYIEDDAGRSELYDLKADPGELLNIAGEQPNTVAAGKLNVKTLREHVGASAIEVQDAATRAMLESMGYSEK